MKKALALFLCLVMILSMAACGSKTTTETKPESKPEATQASASGDKADEKPAANVPELKGPGNVTLKRLGYNTAFDPNDNIGADIIEQSTGYKVEYYMLPSENANEKLIMDISGGADYDAINISINQFLSLIHI